MKLDVTQVLKDYQNKPIFKSEMEKGEMVKTEEKLTLRDVISIAINATPANRNKPMTAEEKNKAYQISIKIWSEKEVDLTIDQLAFIKKRVVDVYNPLVAGRVSDILEGKRE